MLQGKGDLKIPGRMRPRFGRPRRQKAYFYDQVFVWKAGRGVQPHIYHDNTQKPPKLYVTNNYKVTVDISHRNSRSNSH